MTNTHQRQLERQRGHRHNRVLAGFAVIAIIGLAGFAITQTASGGSAPEDQATSDGASSDGATTDGATTDRATTEATNSMGMPIIATPGTATGTATASGITAEPATWSLGQVPLDVAVRPSWTFTNTGNDIVTVGEPHVQINQGCCPGALTFQGSTTLAPGATTALTFELSMHPGMDGPHDMTLHIPVTHANGITGTVDVTVTGDFRN